MHWELGGYRPCDIRLAAAWDIDRRKVGRDIAEAIFARPNCTQTFCGDVRPSGVKVEMGRLLDGCADHMADHPDERTFLPADAAEPDRRSEEHTSELQSLMRTSYAVFCLKKKKTTNKHKSTNLMQAGYIHKSNISTTIVQEAKMESRTYSAIHNTRQEIITS